MTSEHARHGTAVGVAAAWVAVVLAGAPLFAAAHVRQLYHDDKLHDGPTQRKFGHVFREASIRSSRTPRTP